MGPSIAARALEWLMRVCRVKSRGRLARLVMGPDVPIYPSADMRRRVQVIERTVRGRTVYTVSPRKPSPSCAAPALQILYLHGGAYVGSFIKQHWALIEYLAVHVNAGGGGAIVIAPDYGLAPQYSVDDAMALLPDVYSEMLTAAGGRGDTIVFMGDSAGGALALALAAEARERGMQLPAHLVLLSPWLDAVLDNPAIPALDAQDPILNLPRLIANGRAWAGARDPRDSRVSPARMSLDELRGLPPMTLYIGTRDLLVADCRAFRDRAAGAGVALTYHEKDRLLHCYMLMPLREARETRDEIVMLLACVAAVAAVGDSGAAAAAPPVPVVAVASAVAATAPSAAEEAPVVTDDRP